MEVINIVVAVVSLVAIAGVVYPFKPFGKRRNALVTLLVCFALAGFAAPTPEGEEKAAASSSTASSADARILAIPSDPTAKNLVTGIDMRPDGMFEISTRRESVAGTSFAIRLVQCEPLRFGYVATGDSEAGLVRDPSPKLTEPVSGSISDVVVKYACAQQSTPTLAPARRDGTAEETTRGVKDAAVEKRAKLEEAVRNAVETLRWTDARDRYRALSFSGSATDAFRDEIETRMLALVRPLPASEREINLNGYQFLAAVRPDKPEYVAKVERYKEAIQAARERAVTRLRKSEDRIEGITWFKHPNQPRYLNSRSTAYLYIGKRGRAGRPWLRMQVQYTSSDWLFVERVIAWRDGFKEPLVSGYFERDNNTTIWEWMDVTPDEYQIEVLRSLASAREAILRFEGSRYHRDVKLSAGDKKALREVLEAYEVMRSGQP